MNFISVLTKSLRETGKKSRNYSALVGIDDKTTNQLALSWGMITLPKGHPNDPSEHWIFAQEE